MLVYLWYVFLVVATFVFMEGVAWFMHKYVMHGLLWYLHKDHHQKEPGFFEKNDSFFIIFATPSIILLWFGVTNPTPWMIFVGFGIFLYGAAYFIVHDVIIHQRFKWLSRSNNEYVRALRWSHKMHHKKLDRFDGESFGMLFVARKYWEKVKRDRVHQSPQNA